MTRSHAGAPRGRSRRRQRFASITGLIALLSAVLVVSAAPARALSACTNTDPYCPVANEDDYTINFGTKLVVAAAQGLLANDHGPASTHVSTAPADTDTTSWNNAKVTVKADGSFTYTPDPDPTNAFSGVDSFDYTIIDAVGDSDFNTAYITVNPVVRPDTYTAKPNPAPLIVGDPGVLANDGGIDPDSLVFPTESVHGGTISDAGQGAFVYTPFPGFQGIDSFQYTGTDLDFDPETYTGTVTIYVDATPPSAGTSAPGVVTWSTKVPFTWSATDSSGIATYDTQYNIAVWNAPFTGWRAWKTATTTTSATLAGTYGRTFCFRVRAKDRAGNYSPFTAQRCTSVPVRALSLAYSARWTRPLNAAYWTGEAFTTNLAGQNATLANVQAQHMWLVATKCPSCGALQVRWNNVVIGGVNLAAPTTQHHVLIPIAAWAAPKAGTLRFYVTSPNGKPVIIEGLAVLRA